MDIQAKEAAIRGYIDAWRRGDVAPLARLLDPDVLYQLSWGPRYQGLNNLRACFVQWHRHAKVERWDILSFLHQGDRSVAEWRFRSAHRGGEVEDLMGLSLVEFSARGHIAAMREFGAKHPAYDGHRPGNSPWRL